MRKHVIYIPALVILFFFAGCKSSIKPGDLYGKWKYIKIEHPDAGPAEMPAAQLQNASPSIEFLKNGGYVIIWGGKALSHGTFTTDGMNIRIKENLQDGTSRAFSFWVSELKDNEIVFATLGQDGSKVTAVRE